MKINYKIVWLDDQPKPMMKYIDGIKSILRENYFIPDIQEPYISYEDFHRSFETSTANDVYGEVFNDCDLLLIDYNIAEKQENEEKTGVTLISQLRSKGIYTETVFYSNAMEDYRKRNDRAELDNVIYADKNELLNKVEQIVKKSVVQSMIISNLRGYLMDCTSDFDFLCRTISEYYFIRLKDDQQIEILLKAEEYIHNQYESEIKKFENINKKYKGSVNLTGIPDIKTFAEISDVDKRLKLLREIFNSQESVIVVRDKFRIMSFILHKSDIKNYSDIYINDAGVLEKNNHEGDKYYNKIIKHRNNLAHNKLIYGEKCRNRIKIIKIIDDILCKCDNNECEKSYSYEDCKKLRESIYNYYLLFNNLSDPVFDLENKNKNHA
jgi:hypothetical protein